LIRRAPRGEDGGMSTFAGRYQGKIDGDFVVFLIGMRINRPWQVRDWIFVARAMPKMIKELEAHPETGFLGASSGFMYGTLALVQFWRSFEQLERYARDPQAEHLPAWRKFNQRIRDNGNVGIWHETYKVRAGEYEAIYGNTPRIGLAGVGEHTALGSSSTAARRIGARADDTAPVTGY
jgi:hypothetical protein